MARHSKTWMGGGLLAVLGLSALSPVQQAGVGLAAAGMVLWSAPALAGLHIPGVGLVVKKKPGNAAIIAPSDKDGITRLTGLAPGEYEVKLFGDVAPVTMNVGRDGRLAFVALQDSAKATVGTRDGKTRGDVPVLRQWVEQIPFDGGTVAAGPVRGQVPSAVALGEAAPVARQAGPKERIKILTGRADTHAAAESFDTRSAAIIDVTAAMPDVNTSTAEQLMTGTNNSRKAAAFIVAEREKDGPYKDPLDFARRVGSKVTVDFGESSAQIGDTAIMVRRGFGPPGKEQGFKAEAGSGVVELYNAKHNYVGHVTLLR